MRSWKTILALTVCLCLLAGGAFAEKRASAVKVMAHGDDEKEMKVEVTETDGKAHVKIWEIKDGEEVLVEEYEADADDERVLKLDGERCIMIRGDDDDAITCKVVDGHVMIAHDDEDFTWTVADGDHDFSWVDAGGTWLGVSLTDLDDARAEYFETDEGALVTEVHEDSPAAKAGFKLFDIITKVGDTEIADAGDAVEAVRGREAGDEVEITVRRKGKKKTLKATLAEREGHAFAFGGEHAPKMLFKHFDDMDGHRKVMRLHRDVLTDVKGLGNDEVENLRADIEELRAMIEELKADKD